MSSNGSPIGWRATAYVVVTFVGAGLGAGLGGVFILTAGIGLVSTICLGIPVTLLSGFGGWISAVVMGDLFLKENVSRIGLKDHRLAVMGLAIIGVAVGIIAGGGALAAAVGAFALVGGAYSLWGSVVLLASKPGAI